MTKFKEKLKASLIRFSGHALAVIIKIIGAHKLTALARNEQLQRWVNRRIKRRLEKKIPFFQHNQKINFP